jgi:hypothetical protein
LNAGIRGHDGKLWQGRFELAPNVFIATLDEAETMRVLQSAGSRFGVGNVCRLEVHNFEITHEPVDDGPEVEFASRTRPRVGDEALIVTRRLLGLLSLSVRMAPTWPGIALDIEVEGTWVRFSRIPWSGGFYEDKYSYLPMERLETFGRLVQHWPTHIAATIEQSLEYYYQSIVDRPQHTAKGLTSAAIAFESLLGRGLSQELSHRLSQRGALLCERGPDAEWLYGVLKGWYNVRSKLVHDAVSPNPEVVVRLQQFLMRAIPSMGRLAELAGSHAAAIEALDRAPYERSAHLESLFDEVGWWNYVDVRGAFDKPAL